MKKSEFLARNHWSLTSTYQLKTGFDFCLRIKASTFIISYDLPPPFFSIDVFRDKVLSLGFSRSVSLVQCVWLPANLKGVGLSFSWSLRAISQGRSGGRAGKGRRACNYVSGIWIPPPIPLWLPVDWAVRFPPISAKRKRSRIKQTLKNAWKHAPRVMTSLLMSSPPISISHWLFPCRYSNSRDELQTLLPFPAPKQECRGDLARRPLFMLSNRPLLKLWSSGFLWSLNRLFRV